MEEKPAPDFTLDEVAREMARVVGEMYDNLGPPGPSDPGLTSKEYAELWGDGWATAKEKIRKLFDKGLLIKGTKWARRSDGRWAKYPVYRPKEEDNLV